MARKNLIGATLCYIKILGVTVGGSPAPPSEKGTPGRARWGGEGSDFTLTHAY